MGLLFDLDVFYTATGFTSDKTGKFPDSAKEDES
jgi:hypothetical protein